MSGFRARVLGVALLAGVLAAPGTLQADDGRREINQAGVLAAGGFPFVISSPGSYVLTSDLTPPADVIGIRIDTDDVAVDLNGFAIRGGLVCVPGSCTGTGPSVGIGVPASPLTNGRRCSVRNGSIIGVNQGISLRNEAFVDAVSVSNTFVNGIVLGPNSLVTRTRVTSVGRAGLLLGAGSGYGQNVIARTGQFLALGSVLGGKPVGANVCDDGRCPGARRFYLTQTPVPANQALTQCDPGFHMASRWEVQQVSTLRYDAVRGFVPTVVTDQLPGPPTGTAGWIRTATSGGLPSPGVVNCDSWRDASNGNRGTTAALTTFVPAPEGSFTLAIQPCDSPQSVWCIEDD